MRVNRDEVINLWGCLLLFGLLLSANHLIGQTDTLLLRNGDQLVGEIKEMKRGVLILKTAYSSSDFQIDWEDVIGISSQQQYAISLSDKHLLTKAHLQTKAPGKFLLVSPEGQHEVSGEMIVDLRQIETYFWSKWSAHIDAGYSLTKANDLQQFHASASVGYRDERWVTMANYRQVRNRQIGAETVRRIDGGLNADYGFRNGLFLGSRVNFLSNTEQNLDLRTTGVLGLGYYFIRSNKLYWNAFAGPVINLENVGAPVSPENLPASDRQSAEAVVGSELNLYDIGDLNVFSNAYWYPSLTENSRYRFDFQLNIRYDLPLDFYIKSGLTLNYDNQPAAGASESDYVIITGFGWEL